MPVQIALTGPGGSGKTTLVKALSKFGFATISEQFRGAAAETGYMSVNIGSDLWMQTQIRGMEMQIRQEELLVDVRFASDRTVYDYFAYAEAYVNAHDGEAFMRELDRLYDLCKSNGAGNYAIVFFVPPHDGEIEKDGFRAVNEEFCHIEKDAMETVKELVEGSNTPLILLANTTVEGRLAEIMGHASITASDNA